MTDTARPRIEQHRLVPVPRAVIPDGAAAGVLHLEPAVFRPLVNEWVNSAARIVGEQNEEVLDGVVRASDRQRIARRRGALRDKEGR